MKPHRLKFVVTPHGPAEIEEKPKRRMTPFPRKRAPIYKRPRFYDKALPLDIDMTKFEKLSSGFCGCGQRMVDGAICPRCFGLDFPVNM